MGEPAERLPTFDELYAAVVALPPGLTGEILRPGVLRVMGRPGGPHRRASWRIRRGLASFDQIEGGVGWWFEVEAEIRFGDRLLVPDLAAWRAPESTEFADENPILLRPDWVCEILSRSTQREDRVEKMPIYASSGVPHAWVVDPAGRRVEVHVLAGPAYEVVATASGDERAVLPPFDVAIDVGAWWATTR